MALWGVFAIVVSFLSIHSPTQEIFDPTSLPIPRYRSATSLLKLPDGKTIRSFIGGQQTVISSFWLISGQNVIRVPQKEKNTQPGIDKSKAVHSPSNDEIPPPPMLSGISDKQINIGHQTKFLPDLELLDQNGKKVRFYSDLIKDKIVLVSFFYTSCSYTCLRQGKVFSDLQAELGDRLGKDIFLISVTMDPETDTPERLKTWGTRFGVRKGWTLVTGGKAEMGKLVGHLTDNPLGRQEMHAPFIYMGNDKKNSWTGAYGLTEPKQLVKKIEEMR
jgi:cytochrome oxidase Cu insertion factor (SCO1/SenC/PrrC family)